MNRGVVALVTGGASGLGLATVRHVIKTGGKALIADLPGSKGSTIAQEMSDNCRYCTCGFWWGGVTCYV